MDDLISRNAVLDIIDRKSVRGKLQVAREVAKLPSVQQEIIHCKDCKKYKTMYCAMDIWTADMKIYKASPYDFCSSAERMVKSNADVNT